VDLTYGVCSKVGDDKHILMWDFDDISYEECEQILSDVQERLSLPNIYILKTSERHFVALSFYPYHFKAAWRIIATTPRVDSDFLRVAAANGYFTIRIGPKNGRGVQLESVLLSDKPELSIHQLRSWVVYVPSKYYESLDVAIPESSVDSFIGELQIMLSTVTSEKLKGSGADAR